MTWQAWLKGLAAAFIGGAANGITTMIVAPDQFNLAEGLGKLGTVCLVSGIVAAALYLKQSPVPPDSSSSVNPTRFVPAILLALLLGGGGLWGCAGNTKPVLAKFDAGALTAVQVIAQTETQLSAAGALSPQQSLAIRKALSPVIEIGAKATDALIAWKPGEVTPAVLWDLSTKLGALAEAVVKALPEGSSKSTLMTAIAAAQSAWAAALQIIEAGRQPELTPDLVGVLAYEGGAR